MIRCIIFDFDGTLMDTNEIIRLSLNELSLKYKGKPLSQRDLLTVWGQPLEKQMAGIGGGDVNEMIEFYRDFYNRHRDGLTRIFNGVEDMLRSLSSEGVSMGIVSSKGTGGIRHGLEKFNLSKYFSVVLSKYDVQRHKPDPEGLVKAMALLGSSSSDTLYVGDSLHDLQAAKNAGLPFVLVAWSAADLESLKALHPNYVIETPAELLDIVKACG